MHSRPLNIRHQFTFAVFLAAIVLTAGCVPRLRRNPLEGWSDLGNAYREKCPFGQVVLDDYQNYIRNLPVAERNSIDELNINFYEDATKQRAVEITVPNEGVRWKHVLIYDEAGRRTNTMKYPGSSYRS